MPTPSHNTEAELMATVDAVADALRQHARACLAEPAEVPPVVASGEALVSAVLVYEQLIADRTGWSNPLRHLGLIDRSAKGAELPQDDSAATDRIRVETRFELEILDLDGLANLVEGRGGERPSTAVEGVRFLAASDGWDPHQYPMGILRPTSTAVEAQRS